MKDLVLRIRHRVSDVTWLVVGLLIPATLILFVMIFKSNEILSHFSTIEFRNRQQARALAQIRAQLAMSSYYCTTFLDQNAKLNPVLREEMRDACYTNIEGAMAQVNEDMVANKDNQLRKNMESIYSRVEKFEKFSTFEDRIELARELAKVADQTGIDESLIWGEQTAEYSHLLTHFRSYYRFFYLLMANIVGISVLLVVGNWLKVRNDRRLESAEKEVEASRVQLIHQGKMSALGEMAAGIAHEINNPLTVIKSKAALIKREAESGAPDGEKIGREVVKISSMSDRVAKIIRGLRNFARDGAADPFEETNLVELVSDVLEITAARMQDHGVELRIIKNDSPVIADIRPTQILQVMVNLLTNAHDAIEKNENKWVELSIHDQKNSVEIWVIDSGTGIPKHIQEKIFQPFFTTKEVGKGTGLGLSITVGIIKSHGGTISIDNKSPNTKFVVSLPKKHIEPAVKTAS